VYGGNVGRNGEAIAIKVVPLIEDTDWCELANTQPGSGATPHEMMQHFAHWQKVMTRMSSGAVNNAALCEAAFFEMASDVAQRTGAPWFVRFYGAFRIGSLDVSTAVRSRPVNRRPRARTGFLKARRAEHKRIVRDFVQRVPAVLICTDRCAMSLDGWLKTSDAPIEWARLRALLAQAACAVFFLKSLGLTHNDYHMNNLMVTPTSLAEICVADGTSSWRVPTAGQVLQVVDFGLSTAAAPADPPQRRKQRVLNQSSLAAIRYRRQDPNVDMRTLMLDVATCGVAVLPPPVGPAEQAKRRDDGNYDAVCRCVELYARADTDGPDDRPWLLGLLDDRAKLHAEAAEINAEDDESNDNEDEVYGSLGASLLAIRRVANCRRSAKRQRTVPHASVVAAFLGGFEAPVGDDESVVVLPVVQ
jgi:hypothetical protein